MSLTEHLTLALADLDGSSKYSPALERHWELILQWNDRVNLTSVLDEREAAYLHYRDSLEALAFLRPGPILDIGSGAGFPGVPLAVATKRPCMLMEPRDKRVSFLQTVKATLGLANVMLMKGRSDHPVTQRFPNVVSRATFSDRAAMLACLQWVAPGGRFIAFRSEPSEPPAPESHVYELLGRPRVLELWGPDDAPAVSPRRSK